MKCPKCGENYEDSFQFCPHCAEANPARTSFSEMEPSESEVTAPVDATQVPEPTRNRVRLKKGSALAIAAIVCIAAVLAIVLPLTLSSGGNPSEIGSSNDTALQKAFEGTWTNKGVQAAMPTVSYVDRVVVTEHQIKQSISYGASDGSIPLSKPVDVPTRDYEVVSQDAAERVLVINIWASGTDRKGLVTWTVHFNSDYSTMNWGGADYAK